MISLFSLFGFLTLILGSILVAAAIATLMVRQVREIGAMKAVGAGSRQIAAIYLLTIAAIALPAILLGIPTSRLLAKILADIIATLLNLNIHSQAIPAWVPLVQLLSGLFVPLSIAFFPIRKASKMTVREAMGNYGVSAQAQSGRSVVAKGSTRIRRTRTSFALAARNIFRQKSRLCMTLLLLSTGGGMFMTALNISQAWDMNLQKISKSKLYDLEVQLAEPISAGTPVLSRIEQITAVKTVEGWSMLPMAFYRGTEFSITRTYPDKGHGSAFIFGLDPETTRNSIRCFRYLLPII